MPQQKIEVTVDVKNVFEKAALVELLKAIALLPADDRDRISQVIKHPKGLPALKEHWELIKQFA